MGDMTTSNYSARSIGWRAFLLAVTFLMLPAAASSSSQQEQPNSGSVAPLAVKISQLMNDPYAFVDKSVTIVGAVGDVCPARGCWAEVIGSDGGSVRFKVPDGQLVFTAAMTGDQVTATGVFRAHDLNPEQATAWLAHLAAERGEAFDPNSHIGKLTIFQLEGDDASLHSEVHSL
jgi:hypothetical protein